MKHQKLFEQYNLTGKQLNNRFLMVPKICSRASQPDDISNF